tara:strand:+ start:201 stop:944 length:744 start_codon:yes stop_codon:yes gene_type:complete
MDIISGEIIQLSCDHYIGNPEDFDSNPKIKNEHHKFIFFNKKHTKINNRFKIFCYTHLLNNFDNLFVLLKCFQNKFELYFHNSDTNFENKHLKLFEINNLSFIFTQNMNVTHEKVKPLPIGLANEMWPHGNIQTLQKIQQENNIKTENVYFNFKIKTNKKERKICYNSLIKCGLKFTESQPHEEYLRTLSKHKYAICPQGNGIDTHRFWECIYLNVIPVVKRCVLTEYYSDLYNIVLLDSWDKFKTD